MMRLSQRPPAIAAKRLACQTLDVLIIIHYYYSSSHMNFKFNDITACLFVDIGFLPENKAGWRVKGYL